MVRRVHSIQGANRFAPAIQAREDSIL